MPDVSSIGPGSLGPVNRTEAAQADQIKARGSQVGGRHDDRVELSGHAKLLDRLRQMPEVRQEFVEKVRQAIAQGTYESPDKLNESIQRLIDELNE